MTPAAAGPGSTPARIYTVRLVFAEIEGLAAGARRFDVALQGRERLTDFDIAREAGGPWREIVKEFHEVAVRDHLRITLTPRGGAKPVLCGIQAILQARGF
jgi:hypothetical protein